MYWLFSRKRIKAEISLIFLTEPLFIGDPFILRGEKGVTCSFLCAVSYGDTTSRIVGLTSLATSGL